MPRGKSLRPAPPGHPNLYVRIVKNIHDSTLDKFIPIEEAQPLINKGALKEINMGKAYPNSFVNN
jgi:hypothetical protein